MLIARNIIASYIYPDNQAPRYWLACVVEGIAIVLSIALTLAFSEVLKRENKKLDEREGGSGAGRFRYIH